MTQTQLALVVHFHQPVGNLDSVVEKVTDRCYRPFLEILAQHPQVRMTLHYSGCLLSWLEANASDVTARLKEMVARGQVELMTGGFYEPILAALPRVDQTGQIRMLTEHLAKRYGFDASGLWLAERVWEQDVIPGIVDAGVSYTVVDDTIFHTVGVSDKQMTGPFVTEHEGRPLLVYPGDHNLRYLIPYKRVSRVVDYLLSRTEDRLFVYADDGEKFGEWPDTHERVYSKGWLRDFFEELGKTSERLKLVTLGEHARGAEPVGRVYLPSASYDEMMTWALPSEPRLKLRRLRHGFKDDHESLAFVKGAPWRSFLAKYPEVNQLQKRMAHVSSLVHDADAPPEALSALYKAQCNCAYWHGAFGGAYISFMRAALWHHLMRAEALARGEPLFPAVEVFDLDADGSDEIMIATLWGSVVLSPRLGRMVEFDDHAIGANLLAVMARHKEAYHIADESPQDDSLPEDDEMEAAHASAEVDRAELVFDEDGFGGVIDVIDGRRVPGPYRFSTRDGVVELTTAHDGLSITKRFEATPSGLLIEHTIANPSKSRRSFRFGTESFVMPLNLGRDEHPDAIDVEPSRWAVYQLEGEVGLEAALTVPSKDCACEPVASASATMEGLARMHQGSRILTSWNVDLEPGKSFSVAQTWSPLVTERADKRHRGVGA